MSSICCVVVSITAIRPIDCTERPALKTRRGNEKTTKMHPRILAHGKAAAVHVSQPATPRPHAALDLQEQIISHSSACSPFRRLKPVIKPVPQHLDT